MHRASGLFPPAPHGENLEAPFRFPIKGLADVEQLFQALQSSPHLVAASLRLTEGADLLAQQLAGEKRGGDQALLHRAQQQGAWTSLLRALWEHPLATQRPRFLRFEAELAANPAVTLSIRIDVPVLDARPRWINAEGSRDPVQQSQLIAVYRALAQASGLAFVEV